jgi:hypothetical protein
MASLLLEVPEESACEACGTSVPMTEHLCGSCGANAFRVPFDQFFALLERLEIMDARFGGLVIGRNDAADDIPMFRSQGNYIFAVAGLMQGGEYILSQAATLKHFDELVEINSEFESIKSLESIPAARSVIDTRFMPKLGGLWLSKHQFVINRFATRKYITRLDEMNSAANRAHAAELELAQER